MDCSPPDSSVNGILQAEILAWVAIPFSMESSRPRDRTPVPALQMEPLLSETQGNPQYLVVVFFFFFLIIDLIQSTTHTYLTTTDLTIQFSSVVQWCLTLCNPVDKNYGFGYYVLFNAYFSKL